MNGNKMINIEKLVSVLKKDLPEDCEFKFIKYDDVKTI